MKAIDGAIHEGKAAYILGAKLDANPYRAAMVWYQAGRYDDALAANLTDWECQWDSGYAVAKRESRFNA
jgi:hypothetical protein